MALFDKLLVDGYTRNQYKHDIPDGIKSMFLDYYHVPLGFDSKDFGDESAFKRLDEKTIEKTEDDNNYTFVFLDGVHFYGCIECKFKIISLDNCCDINIGIMTENEYNSKYITHSQQIEKFKNEGYDWQTPYNYIAVYNGYTGCLFVDTLENGISGDPSKNCVYGVDDIVTLKLDFNRLKLTYYNNDEQIHETDVKTDTKYKIFVNTFSQDIIQLL